MDPTTICFDTGSKRGSLLPCPVDISSILAYPDIVSSRKTPAQKAKLKLQERALELNNEGWKHASIARELGIHSSTLRKWFKKLGVPPKRVGGGHDPNPKVGTPIPDPLGKAIADGLTKEAGEIGVVARAEAIATENQHIIQQAQEALTPADQYQSYVATKGIQLLKRGLGNLRPPSTIGELEKLDGIIRRNLGLDNKNGGGGGGGALRVDINILNNHTPDTDESVLVGDVKTHEIDVEAMEAETRKQLGLSETETETETETNESPESE